MFITIEVHSLEEIKPSLPMRQAARLSLKISIDKHQLCTLIMSAFDDFKIDQLNEILNCEGMGLHYTENKD